MAGDETTNIRGVIVHSWSDPKSTCGIYYQTADGTVWKSNSSGLGERRTANRTGRKVENQIIED